MYRDAVLIVSGVVLGALGAGFALQAFRGVSKGRAIAWLVIEGGVALGLVAMLVLSGLRGMFLFLLAFAALWVGPLVATRVTGLGS